MRWGATFSPVHRKYLLRLFPRVSLVYSSKLMGYFGWDALRTGLTPFSNLPPCVGVVEVISELTHCYCGSNSHEWLSKR